MRIQQSTCGNCGGLGSITLYDIIKKTETEGICQVGEQTCSQCDGKVTLSMPVFPLMKQKQF